MNKVDILTILSLVISTIMFIVCINGLRAYAFALFIPSIILICFNKGAKNWNGKVTYLLKIIFLIFIMLFQFLYSFYCYTFAEIFENEHVYETSIKTYDER